MKKSSLAVFAFALLAAAAPFAALLVPPAAPTPPTDSVQADDLSPAACYHSISNGVTEASQNVWTSALPYLQGVASPWDKTADGYETTITYSCEQVDAILQGLGLEPETLADTAPAAWFGAAQLDEAGYVASMSVCGEAFSGTRLRRALALRSTCFTVQYADGTFTFTTRGYGHCVGLSQHGAQSMAEGGADWRELLTYYFPGCEVVE